MDFFTHCKGESAQIWRVSNEDGKFVVRMQWGTNLRMLYAAGAVLENATGLSLMQQNLLIQRGAVESSLVHEEDGSRP